MKQSKILFTKSASPFIAKVFGWRFNDAGFLSDETTGHLIPSTFGTPVHIDSFLGVKSGFNGEPVPLTGLIDYIKLTF